MLTTAVTVLAASAVALFQTSDPDAKGAVGLGYELAADGTARFTVRRVASDGFVTGPVTVHTVPRAGGEVTAAPATFPADGPLATLDLRLPAGRHLAWATLTVRGRTAPPPGQPDDSRQLIASPLVAVVVPGQPPAPEGRGAVVVLSADRRSGGSALRLVGTARADSPQYWVAGRVECDLIPVAGGLVRTIKEYPEGDGTVRPPSDVYAPSHLKFNVLAVATLRHADGQLRIGSWLLDR